MHKTNYKMFALSKSISAYILNVSSKQENKYEKNILNCWALFNNEKLLTKH